MDREDGLTLERLEQFKEFKDFKGFQLGPSPPCGREVRREGAKTL